MQRDELEAFLDELGRRGLPLGAGRRIDAHRLLAQRPELRELGARRELGASLAALLATSEGEYETVARAFEQRFGAGEPRRPAEVPEVAGSRPIRVLRKGMPWIVTVLLAAVLFRTPPDTRVVSSADGGLAAPIDAGPVHTSTQPGVAACVPIATASTSSATYTPPPRSLEAPDYLAMLLGLLGVALGLGLLGFAVLERRALWEKAKADRHKAGEEQRRLSNLLDAPVRARAASRYGLDRSVLLETTTALQRLTESSFGPGLDSAETARATALAAGLFSPVLEERRHRVSITALVDLEDGDHVWLGYFLRVLEDWTRQGVALDVYWFTGHPTVPEDPVSRRRVALETLARQARGPLLLYSRGLSNLDRMGSAAWVRALAAWPLRVWIDPEPPPGLMAARLVAALERAGLVRFPATAQGLIAMVRYLASAGESRGAVKGTSLPPVADPAVQEALRLWRIGVALVPTPTWDLVERLRRTHPVLSRVLPDRACVRLLLDSVDQLDEAREGVAGKGPALVISQPAYRKWLGEVTPADQEFARWAIQAHSDYLEALEPGTVLDQALNAMYRARNLARRLGTEEAWATIFAPHLNGLAAEAAKIEWDDEVEVQARRGAPMDPVLVETVGRVATNTPPGTTAWRRLWAARRVAWGAGLAAALLFAGAARVLGAHRPLLERPPVRVPIVPSSICRLDLDAARVLPATPFRPAMVPVRAATFQMGSPPGEDGRYEDESLHPVRVVNDFWLAETELTQGQWQALYQARQQGSRMGPNPSFFTAENGGGDTHPVERVFWYDAVGYANELSAQEGLEPCYRLRCAGTMGENFECTKVEFLGVSCPGYRLPTEAEWELAARAGTTTALYSGPIKVLGLYNAPAVGVIGWYGGNSGLSGGQDCSGWTDREDVRSKTCGTQPVRGKGANPFGFYDIIGNVWEWTNDVRADYIAEPSDDPGARPWREPPSSAVIRGCSWPSGARSCRAARRGVGSPSFRYGFVGFRLARSVPRPLVH